MVTRLTLILAFNVGMKLTGGLVEP